MNTNKKQKEGIKMKKIFVGGYYDDRVFKGDYFDGKTPFGKDIKIYSLDEVLKLAFVEPVKDWYKDTTGKEFDNATELEQVKAIMDYTEGDEIAGLVQFNTETEAKKFKDEVLTQIEHIENHIQYVGKEQDSYGNFKEVYEYKK